MNLRELTQGAKDILAAVEQSTNEDMKTDLSEQLADIQLDRTDKIENILYVINNYERMVNEAKLEIARLKINADLNQKKVNKLKDWLRLNLEAGERFEFALFNLSVSPGAKSVCIDDESEIPSDYITIKTESKPDKKAMAVDLKAGIEIPGARLVDGEKRLTIK